MKNTELGRKIIDIIDTEPERFEMGHWGEVTECGTTACIAGHAMLLSGYTYNVVHDRYERPSGTVVLHEAREAAKLLGMDEAEPFYPAADGNVMAMLWYDMKGGPDRFRKLVEESEGQA